MYKLINSLSLDPNTVMLTLGSEKGLIDIEIPKPSNLSELLISCQTKGVGLNPYAAVLYVEDRYELLLSSKVLSLLGKPTPENLISSTLDSNIAVTKSSLYVFAVKLPTYHFVCHLADYNAEIFNNLLEPPVYEELHNWFIGRYYNLTNGTYTALDSNIFIGVDSNTRSYTSIGTYSSFLKRKNQFGIRFVELKGDREILITNRSQQQLECGNLINKPVIPTTSIADIITATDIVQV